MGTMINTAHTGTRVRIPAKHPFKHTAHIKFLMDGDVGRVDVHARYVECGTNTDFIKNRYWPVSLSLSLSPPSLSPSANGTMRIPNVATIVIVRLLFRSTSARTTRIEKMEQIPNNKFYYAFRHFTMIQISIYVPQLSCN